jgi:hypothetical protein
MFAECRSPVSRLQSCRAPWQVDRRPSQMHSVRWERGQVIGRLSGDCIVRNGNGGSNQAELRHRTAAIDRPLIEETAMQILTRKTADCFRDSESVRRRIRPRCRRRCGSRRRRRRYSRRRGSRARRDRHGYAERKRCHGVPIRRVGVKHDGNNSRTLAKNAKGRSRFTGFRQWDEEGILDAKFVNGGGGQSSVVAPEHSASRACCNCKRLPNDRTRRTRGAIAGAEAVRLICGRSVYLEFAS